jgi:hypothetical protein
MLYIFILKHMIQYMTHAVNKSYKFHYLKLGTDGGFTGRIPSGPTSCFFPRGSQNFEIF